MTKGGIGVEQDIEHQMKALAGEFRVLSGYTHTLETVLDPEMGKRLFSYNPAKPIVDEYKLSKG